MRRSRFIVTVAAVPLALGLSSCMDDGAGVRSEAVGEYASSSSSASGASASGSTAAEGSAPAGVVAEYETMAAEIAAEGGQRTSGKWRVGYIVEAAESWFETRGGKQVFRPVAGGETHHIEILPFEAATGRLVPDVPVRLEILDSSGKPVQAKRLRFLHGSSSTTPRTSPCRSPATTRSARPSACRPSRGTGSAGTTQGSPRGRP